MSIYAVSDDDELVQIASNSGWSQFGDWAETLDAKEFPAIVGLWEHGIYEPALQLESEMKGAQERMEPIEDVVGIIEELLTVCRGATFVLITNGMTNTKENDETEPLDE